MSPFIPSTGGSDDILLTSQTLSANGNLDLQNLGSVIPTGIPFVKLLTYCRVHGNTNTFNWEHIWLTFNADTTINDYAWSVVNSNATTATSALASGTVGTGTSGILAGHAIADTAPVNPMYAVGTIVIWDPTNTASPKTVDVTNNLMTSFTSYTTADTAPIQMEGGTFWIGPGAITRITVQAVTGQLIGGGTAPSKCLLYAGQVPW